MSFQGMDVDAAPGVVDQINQFATAIHDAFSEATNLVSQICGTDWMGEDADNYREEWNSVVQTVDSVQEQIRNFANELNADLEEQSQTSSAL